ncbi:MAG: hypothetical protein CSA81_06215 [Acidobacteria bacterium]|nr:MAG: hypothetical protein CSA81_06215 [Acidobacteriota bacterium]
MTLLLAILLGIIQGLTEFLPISSSGHLAVFGAWLGLSEPDIQFDILIHLATLFAICIVYRQDVVHLVKVPLKRDEPSITLLKWLILATLPAVAVGFSVKPHLESIHDNLYWVAAFLAMTGAVLLLGKRLPESQTKTIQQLGFWSVVMIGCAQAFAIMPGISRSGMTIMAGLLIGMKKEEAARFSFLMAIPAIAGAGVLMAFDLELQSVHRHLLPYAAGFVFAFLTSLLALKFLIHILKKDRFFLFGYYCLALALVTVSVNASN